MNKESVNGMETLDDRELRTKAVVVVDDDEIFLQELSELLALSGYQTVAVQDPLRVLDVVRKIRPELVLLDIKMPEKSGFEVAHEIRDLPEGGNIPIIAVSGFFKGDKLPLMEICGINAFLRKPFHPLDVIHAIEKLLPKTQWN
ncbi:MAG: response regulator [Candidatus Omnitrophota bacterium]